MTIILIHPTLLYIYHTEAFLILILRHSGVVPNEVSGGYWISAILAITDTEKTLDSKALFPYDH